MGPFDALAHAVKKDVHGWTCRTSKSRTKVRRRLVEALTSWVGRKLRGDFDGVVASQSND